MAELRLGHRLVFALFDGSQQGGLVICRLCGAFASKRAVLLGTTHCVGTYGTRRGAWDRFLNGKHPDAHLSASCYVVERWFARPDVDGLALFQQLGVSCEPAAVVPEARVGSMAGIGAGVVPSPVEMLEPEVRQPQRHDDCASFDIVMLGR